MKVRQSAAMDRRLKVLASAQGGVFTTDDAASVGVSSNELGTLARQRVVTRIRRSAYVLTGVLAAAGPDEQYRLRVLAILRSRPGTDRASHQSALALFGIAFFGAPRNVVEAESRTGAQTCRGGLRLHEPTPALGVRFGAIRSVTAAVACVQVAARYGFEAGVCAMDSALHLQASTTADLEQSVEQLATRRHAGVRRAIAAAEPTTESVGESRTRIILRDAGFSVTPQFVVMDGRHQVGRVDFLVDECVIVDFDGLIKYEGADGKFALAAEKDRESRLTRLGFEVVRIVWSDLEDPVAIVHRVLTAKRTAGKRRAWMR